MVRFQVQAVERNNFKGVSRAGRFWPSAEAVDVVVYDQDADPPDERDADGKSTRHTESPRRIGKISFEAMKEDKRLRIINAGDPMAVESETVSNLRARFDKAWADLQRTHAHELERQAERHLLEVDTYAKEIAALRAELEAAKEHAGNLEAEVAELLGAGTAGEATPEGDGKPDDTEPGKKASKKGQHKKGADA